MLGFSRLTISSALSSRNHWRWHDHLWTIDSDGWTNVADKPPATSGISLMLGLSGFVIVHWLLILIMMLGIITKWLWNYDHIVMLNNTFDCYNNIFWKSYKNQSHFFGAWSTPLLGSSEDRYRYYNNHYNRAYLYCCSWHSNELMIFIRINMDCPWSFQHFAVCWTAFHYCQHYMLGKTESSIIILCLEYPIVQDI